MTNFRIEPGAPEWCNLSGDNHADDLGDAIQMAFPMETDDAQMIWCGTTLPISYKYDVGVLIDDVIVMLEQCTSRQDGRVHVNFGSDTFNADWVLVLAPDVVVVTAKWNSVVGDVEDRLNGCSPVLIARMDFVNQWLAVVRRAIEGVDAAGVRISDGGLLSRAKKLLRGEFPGA